MSAIWFSKCALSAGRSLVARMKPTGRREAPPDDLLRESRDVQGLRREPDRASLHPGSPHFASNFNPRVQGVLIDHELGVIARLERGSGLPRLIDRVHRDQWNVIELPLPKAPKWCFSAFHEPVAQERSVRAALQACP